MKTENFTDADILAAIEFVDELIDCEDFELYLSEEDGEKVFKLKDLQQANLGDIEGDSFTNLDSVVDRLDIYHNDYFYEDFAQREKAREEIPSKDWDRMMLILLESEFCSSVLGSVTPEKYTEYSALKWSKPMGYKTGINYLADKSTALKIMDTQSAYTVTEYGGKVYVSRGNIDFDSEEQFKAALVEENEAADIAQAFESYGKLIESEIEQVKDDLSDLGKGNHYLTDYEFGYIGINTMPIRVFIDMDGTLARFHDEFDYENAHKEVSLERMFEKGFFANLKPFENMISGLNEIIKEFSDKCEFFILSACVDGEPPYCKAEKNEWLDRYLPDIPRENRIFTKVGAPKSDYVENISEKDILIDDYNRSLRQWKAAGGTGVKCVNNINHHGLGKYGGDVGNIWAEAILNNCDRSKDILEQFSNILINLENSLDISIPSAEKNRKLDCLGSER